jgi:hypothetical protein
MHNGAFADKFHSYADEMIQSVQTEGRGPIVHRDVIENDQTFNVVGAALTQLVGDNRKPVMDVATDGNVPDVLLLNFKGVGKKEMGKIAEILNQIADETPVPEEAGKVETAAPPHGYSSTLKVPRGLMDTLFSAVQGNLNSMAQNDPGLKNLITADAEQPGAQQRAAVLLASVYKPGG